MRFDRRAWICGEFDEIRIKAKNGTKLRSYRARNHQ